MRRGAKIAIGLLVVLAVLLAVNTITTDSQTKEAATTVPDGEILSLSRGDVQVTDTGEPDAAAGREAAQPIVLVHCYTCSLRWFDRLEPLLAERHRVIRIDLLGHGGSEKPEAGYEIENQAALLAEALSRLEVHGALVVGHSMGAMVATSLAEQASQLVDRVVVIGMAPNTDDFGPGLPFTSQLVRVPVLGHALWRVAPDAVVRDELAVSFAPGFELAQGFSDEDVPVEDYRAMTYTAFDQAKPEADEYVAERPLDQRLTTAAVPLLVIFGAEDELFDAERAVRGYADVPGARTQIVADAGHAPQVEQPQQVAPLIESFSVALPAADTRDAADARERAGRRGRKRGVSASDRRPSPTRRGDRPSRSRQRSDARRDGGRAGREPRRGRERRTGNR